MVQGLVADLVLSGFGLVFVVAGIYTLNLGRMERAQSGRITATETTPIRDLQAGPVEIKGTAHVIEDSTTLQSPITKTDALAAHVEVEEWESSGKAGNWQTIHEEEEGVPMLVDDGTGTVRVELPPDGGINVEQTVTKVESGDEPPDHIRRYVENEAAIEIPTRRDYGPLSIGEPRRYFEGMVEPGEEVYVLGTAREDQADWGERDFVIDTPIESGEFILSDKSEEDLVREGERGGLVYLAFGGIFTIVGVAVVLIPWI